MRKEIVTKLERTQRPVLVVVVVEYFFSCSPNLWSLVIPTGISWSSFSSRGCIRNAGNGHNGGGECVCWTGYCGEARDQPSGVICRRERKAEGEAEREQLVDSSLTRHRDVQTANLLCCVCPCYETANGRDGPLRGLTDQDRERGNERAEYQLDSGWPSNA